MYYQVHLTILRFRKQYMHVQESREIIMRIYEANYLLNW